MPEGKEISGERKRCQLDEVCASLTLFVGKPVGELLEAPLGGSGRLESTDAAPDQ